MLDVKTSRFRRVILESPYREKPGEDPIIGRECNWRYRQAAIADCLRRGDSPYASHQMLTECGLDDDRAEDRRLGMEAGFAWHGVAEAVVVYTDRGISPGMEEGIAHAEKFGVPIEHRQVPGWQGTEGE